MKVKYGWQTDTGIRQKDMQPNDVSVVPEQMFNYSLALFFVSSQAD